MKKYYYWLTDRSHKVYLPSFGMVLVGIIAVFGFIYGRNLPQPFKFYAFCPIYGMILYAICKPALGFLSWSWRALKHLIKINEDQQKTRVKVTRVVFAKQVQPLPAEVETVSNLIASIAVRWIKLRAKRK